MYTYIVQVFLARDDVSSAFEAFTRQHHVEVTVVMGMEIATSGDIHRQLAIHSFSPVFRDQVRLDGTHDRRMISSQFLAHAVELIWYSLLYHWLSGCERNRELFSSFLKV